MEDSTKKLLERLSQLDTCAVSDALDQLKLPGATIGIRPQWPCGKIVGRASTVKIQPAGLTRPEAHLATPAVAEAEEGDVIVIDNGGRPDQSCWGDILSNAAQVKGVRGVIIDGASRDIDGSVAIGFPVYAKAIVPMTARGRNQQESYNQIIQCGGAQVRPGDLVIADGSGAVFLVADQAEEIIATAEKIQAREAEMIQAVRNGKSVVEVMAESAFQAIHADHHYPQNPQKEARSPVANGPLLIQSPPISGIEKSLGHPRRIGLPLVYVVVDPAQVLLVGLDDRDGHKLGQALLVLAQYVGLQRLNHRRSRPHR